MATLQAAGVQWLRLAAWWDLTEPNPPDRNQAIPGVYGRLSGLHTYDYSWLDYYVTTASSYGMKVLLVIASPPTWANGNPDSTCIRSEINCSGSFSQGWAPYYADDLRDLSYSLTLHYGSYVQAIEAWNEPNLAYEFNVNNMPGADYWAVFISNIFSPIHDGVKTANPNMFVIGPAVAHVAPCSTPTSGCDWYSSWMERVGLYARNLWDAMAYNRYPSSHADLRDEMDFDICPLGGPVWVTEVGYSYDNGAQYQSDNLNLTYADMFNREYCWTKTFYHDLHQVPANGPSSESALLNPDYTPRPAYFTYKSMTGH